MIKTSQGPCSIASKTAWPEVTRLPAKPESNNAAPRACAAASSVDAINRLERSAGITFVYLAPQAASQANGSLPRDPLPFSFNAHTSLHPSVALETPVEAHSARQRREARRDRTNAP